MEIWEPIQDLSTGWEDLASTELAGLKDAWREHRERLQGTKALEKFTKEQARQWSIETGIIENLYHIDRGVTQMLVEKGLEASYIPHGTTHKSPEEIIRLLRDHQATLEGLHIFISQQRPLSTSYIKELHQALTRHQQMCDAYDQFGNLQKVTLLRGEWKKYPNNPSREDGSVHNYCPPEQVQSEMDRLIELHLRHVEEQVPPEIEAAWLHHRFTQIHPFQDGNGRVARTLASLIFMRDNWFPLTIDRDQRIPYLDALEAADAGDLAPLAELFASNQSRELGKALALMEEMGKPSIADTVSAIGEYARTLPVMRSNTEEAVRLLIALTRRKFAETQEMLEAQKLESWKFSNTYGEQGDLHYRWVRMAFETPLQNRTFTIEISIILLDGSRVLVKPEYSLKIQSISNPVYVTVPTFQFGDGELPENVLKRYDKWLNEAIIAGLSEWKKYL